MITLHIENEMLEKLYHEEFKDDEAAFIHFLQETIAVNNVEYEEDLSFLNEVLKDPETQEDSGYTLQQAFAMFEKKYYAN